jgi:hypothetical protein
VAALAAAAAISLSGLTLAAPAAAVTAPAAPTGLAPNQSATALKDLELTWAAVPGATSYDVRVFAGDSGPDDEAATVSTYSAPVNRWTAPVNLPRDTYFWQVRARRGAASGPWSGTARFVRGWTAAPTSPTTTAHVDGSPLPTLSWSEVPDASFYEVEISDYPFDSSGEVQTGTNRSWTYYTAHTTFAPYGVAAGPDNDVAPGTSNGAVAVDSAGDATPLSIGTKFKLGKTYYWRVRGRDGSVDATTTPFRAPAQGCTGVWSESDNTISDNGTPADPSDDTVTVPLPAKAPTYKGTPDCSQWVVGQGFVPTVTSLSPSRPSAPTGLAVGQALGGGTSTGDDVTVTDSPSFSWSPVPGAIKYRVTLSRASDLSEADVTWETEASTLTPVSSLALGNAGAYWSVQACTANRLCSLTGAVRHVRKVPATTVAPVSFTQDGHSVVATWTTQRQGTGQPAPQAGADHYRLQVVDSSGTPVQLGAADSVVTDRVADPAQPGTSHWSLPTSGLAEGSYRFRVRAVDVTGRSLPWSPLSARTVVDRAAPTVRLSDGSGVSGRTPVTLVLSEPVTGATAATLAVQDGRGKVAGTLSWQSPTTARFTPTGPWLTGGYLRAWSSGRAVDRAGKPLTATGTSVRAAQTADSAGTAIAFTRGDGPWVTHTASDAVGRSYRSTTDSAATAARASASVLVYGASVTVGVCKSPTSGSAVVFVDGRYLRTVSLYRSWTGCDTGIAVAGLAKGLHRVTVAADADGARGVVSLDRVSVG